MKKNTLLLLFFLLLTMAAHAQRSVISGFVIDAKSGIRLVQANVAVTGTSVAVVTNADGYFTLKTDASPATITVSHVGYQSQRVAVPAGQADVLRISLKPVAVQLGEVVVWNENPRELVNNAIRKIPRNYSQQPELFSCFYRETAMKRSHYIYVAEGVVDMYKSGYSRSTARDRVAIRKGRRILSPRRSDTLTVKVMGGPLQPIQLDIVKNLDFLLNAEELDCYDFKMCQPDVIDGRMQFVVSLSPRLARPYPLYFGRLFIDRETLAFTRAELTLDVSDRRKATDFMLVRKPSGVRFRPKEMSCLVDYRHDGRVTSISYIRSTFRFNCDWRRRLMATSFTAFCEMVVTDRKSEGIQPITGRDSFDSRDAFYDKVDFFLDQHFWEDYNIIEPTETLDKAIDKLVKKYGLKP